MLTLQISRCNHKGHFFSSRGNLTNHKMCVGVCVCLRVYLRVTYACCMSKCTAASGHGRDSAYGDDKAGTEMMGMRIRIRMLKMSKTNMNTKKPSTPMCEACFW